METEATDSVLKHAPTHANPTNNALMQAAINFAASMNKQKDRGLIRESKLDNAARSTVASNASNQPQHSPKKSGAAGKTSTKAKKVKKAGATATVISGGAVKHSRSVAKQVAPTPKLGMQSSANASSSVAAGALATHTQQTIGTDNGTVSAGKTSATNAELNQLSQNDSVAIKSGQAVSLAGNTQQRVALTSTKQSGDADKKKKKRKRGGLQLKARLLSQAEHVAQSMGSSGTHSTPKRERSHGGTPPSLGQAHKKGRTANVGQSITKPSMAQVVADANLIVAITDMPVPNVIVPLTKEKYDKLYQTINSFMLSSLELASGGAIPTFDENILSKGVMKIRCTTPAAKTWLENSIPYFPILWDEMKLTVINFHDLPRSKKVLGLIPYCTASNDNILKMLGMMNACIDPKRWSVINRSDSANNAHITLGMSEDQLDVLKSRNFQLHFGAGIAKFKDISKKQSDVQAQEEAESEMETEEPVENRTDTNLDNTVIYNPPSVAPLDSTVQALHTNQDIGQVSAPSQQPHAVNEMPNAANNDPGDTGSGGGKQ